LLFFERGTRARTALFRSLVGLERFSHRVPNRAPSRKELAMPLYIDFHAKMPPLPPEAIKEMRGLIGRPGSSGATPVGAFFTKDDQGYCLYEAPNPDAVCRDHEEHGMKIEKGDVHEVTARLG
jgi:hypothetical protein